MLEHGFVAVNGAAADSAEALGSTLAEVGVLRPEISRHGALLLAQWGLRQIPGRLLLLTRSTRTRSNDLPDHAVLDRVDGDGGDLTDVVPPFAAVTIEGEAIVMMADSMGLRQTYYGGQGHRAGLSSSALLLGRVLDAELDLEAVAIQSLLGWQLGQRTLVDGVSKLEPGAVATLDGDGLRIARAEGRDKEPVERGEAVGSAARLLRQALAACLDDRPDVVLQLTGGQDSRLLLSAIPESRRRGLSAMTLGVTGQGDVDTAALIAERYGLQHEVHGMSDLDRLEPNEAWSRCLAAAHKLEAMSDPLAFAGLEWAEEQFIPAPRLSGLGGEVARGFYYLAGPGAEVTRRRARQLANWRMFANESAEPESLTPVFRSWSREFALTEVERHLRAGGPHWLAATDELYLRHRMQRWAGVTETAWCLTREIFNPMLDHEFLELAGRMKPADKRNSRFLAELQMELDPELGRLPLEGRPAPEAYTRRSLGGSIERAATTGRRLARKVEQRVHRAHRPPAGGAVLATKIVSHWQQNPEVVRHVRSVGVVDPMWLDEVLAGHVQADASSVAFVTNLEAALSVLSR